MNRRRILGLSGTLLAGALAGCTTGGRQPNQPDGSPEPGITPTITDEPLAELVHETNGLAFDLYDEFVSTKPADNLLASPVSITTALAMAYAGARGDTRDQMREALRYTLNDETLHGAFNALQRELNARGEAIDADDLPSQYDAEDNPVPFQLALVNAVWGQADYPFQESYLTRLENHYGGGLQEVDYRSDHEAAREKINTWVANQTADRIKDLLPPGALSHLTRLVLTNAIYFLANWYHPFDPNATGNEAFTPLNGSTGDVSMMTQSEAFPYAEVNGTKAVDLPYIGEDVSMVVILPPEGRFEPYEQAFDRATLAQIIGALEAREGTVSLPRFEFKSGFALKKPLEALGMPIAFDPSSADFSGIAKLDETNENLYIDDVYHDTYIAVDEEGTEAAAATGVVINAESAPSDPFEFVADRPFLFVIRDRPTDTVLFLGRVIDAGAAQ